MVRTDDDKLSMNGFEVTLGTEKYRIECLKINPQRAWREKLSVELAPLVQTFNKTADQKSFVHGLAGALIDFPEKLADMVFAYAPNLAEKKEKIFEEATEEQLAIAFSNIMSIAFPYLAQLGLVTQVIRASRVPNSQ